MAQIDQQMETAKLITSLRDDLIRFKVTQPTIADSARLYRQTYDAGSFRYSNPGDVMFKYWKIECIPKIDSATAVFMPIMSDDLPVQAQVSYSEPCLSGGNTFYWVQIGYWEGYDPWTGEWESASPGYIFQSPRYFTVYSNVDFEMRATLLKTDPMG